MSLAIRRLFNLGVIALLLALPFTASAIVQDFLFPTAVWQQLGTDSGSAGNVAPWHSWIGGPTTQVCVGNSVGNFPCSGLPGRSGSWHSQAMTFCNTGVSPDSLVKTNTTYVSATCPFPGIGNFGWFMVDAFPYGS